MEVVTWWQSFNSNPRSNHRYRSHTVTLCGVFSHGSQGLRNQWSSFIQVPLCTHWRWQSLSQQPHREWLRTLIILGKERGSYHSTPPFQLTGSLLQGKGTLRFTKRHTPGLCLRQYQLAQENNFLVLISNSHLCVFHLQQVDSLKGDWPSLWV